jgi:hypothetical protein
MRALLPLYIALATLLERRKNLSRRQTPQPEMLDAVNDEIDRLVREHLPRGSGFDNGTTLNFDMSEKAGDPLACPHLLVFDTSFHHMDDQGGYDGWTEHKVIVSPTFLGPVLRVTGRDRKGIKEYIADQFHWVINHKVMADIHIIEVPDAQP